MRLGLARLCLPALALAAVAGLLLDGGPAAGQQQGQPPGGGKGVPVTVATAKRQDVPVWLDGIGNVQAYNTVTIRSRVDGELMKVAFTEGQTVKAGDLLAQIDPRPFQAALDQAKAKKAQDEAQLQNAQRDLERSTDLAQRGFAPRQTLDQQRAQVDQFTAAVQGDDAAIESAQVQLGYATITAPITGRTGMRLVDQGNIVHASDQNGLVTVNQVQPISVVFTLPEQELPGINRELAKGQLAVVATDRDSKEELDRGKLTLVDNQIDPSTGTIRLKATFDNPQGSLWPGQFVNVRLLLRTDTNMVTVPGDAVERGAKGLYAYVVKDDGKVDLRWIKVGTMGDGIAVVEDGINDGEKVVVGGQYRLQPGASVEVRTADAAPNQGDQGKGAHPLSVSAPFIKRPIATSLLMLGVLLAGLVAFPLLPVAPLPQVDFPTIQVSATLPGASPETMASTVAQPLERQFSQIAGVSQMTSTSAVGTTQIVVQFELNRNIDAAAQDVQAAINAAGGQLPKNLPSPPTFRKVNPADRPIMIMGVRSDVLPVTEVDDYADTMLAQRISQIPGVGQVSIGGEQKPAVRVQIDPAKVASLGLSLEDVRGVLANATTNAPKGSIETVTRSFTVYDNDQLTQAPDYDDVIVAYRNGSPVRVRDIGHAIAGPENAKLAAWQNDKPGVLLIVFKQPGANVIETVDRIQKTLPQLEAAIPPAVKVQVMSDRTQTIRASVEDVEFTLSVTIALVVMVIFLFLRHLWATIIPSVTVPLALLGTCGLMYVVGYSLDNLSLMALTIAVGFVVDDAIVMLENIYRHIEEGVPPLEAALKGSAEIGFTIVSISLSLVAVFIPLLLMGGIVGRLFREFAVTVTMTIGVSALVSLTLTPTLCALFLKDQHKKRHSRVYDLSERFFEGMTNGYQRGLDLVLRHRFITLCVFLLTLAASVGLYVAIPKGFFPQQDTGLLIGSSEAAQNASFAEMARLQQQLIKVVLQDPDVANLVSSTGASGGNTGNTGRFFITLKPRNERKATSDEIIARLRPKLDKVEGAKLFLQSSQDVSVGGRQSRTQYQYTLQDPDLEELIAWSPKFVDKLKSLKQLADVTSDQQTEGNTLTLTIDRDQAARFGIQPQVIDDTLYDAFGQRQIAQYFTQTNSYHVVMETLPQMQDDPATLNKIYVKSPVTGQQIPLSTFAKWTTRPVNFLSVNHQGQFPAVTISFNLAPGVALGQAVDAIQKASADLNQPATLAGTFQGTAQAFQSSLSSQPYLIAAALVVVYIILGVLYESYIHPLTILSTLPSAGVGALLMLMANRYELTVIALIGIILLIGIVKKNGIMMVDFAITAERDQGLEPEAAIRQACLLRFRPIMMTTMAALLGSLPLMLGHGTGSEFRQPLGYTMVGGLILSQALTLFTTPVVYLYLDRLNTRLSGRRRHAAKSAQARGREQERQPALVSAE